MKTWTNFCGLVNPNLYTYCCLETCCVHANLTAEETGCWGTLSQEFVTFSYRPDRLWGPPNLLSNAYLALFPRG
jgi:hypothetical protein